jgi:hypothetical protein
MVLIDCPECGNHIRMPAGFVVPDAGRMMACARCTTIWRLHPVDVTRLEDPAPPPIDPAAAEAAAARAVARTNAGRTWRRLGLVLALLVVVVGGCLGAAYAARHHLAVWMPGTRGHFVALGIAVRPSDLSVAATGWRPEPAGGLRVSYRIVNPTVLKRPFPEICVEGRDAEDALRFARCFPPEAPDLASDAIHDASFLVLDNEDAPASLVVRIRKPAG